MATHNEIAQRAYELWELQGHRHGYDLDDWLQAQRDLGGIKKMDFAEFKQEQTSLPEKKDSGQHLVVFLPFLRLKAGHSIAGVDFIPLRDHETRVPDAVKDAETPLLKILSTYVDRHGKRLDNCVVATIPGKGWDLDRKDGPPIMWGSQLLFLAAWATSHYFPRFGGPYTNSSVFRVFGQGYKGAEPVHITLSSRRRDGSNWDGGYRHGKFTASVPLQVSIKDVTEVDEPFLAALDRAYAAKSKTIVRLRTALPFVQLANTDDDVMSEHAEAILMGSAFEQVFATEKKRELTTAFGDLLKRHGSVTVADAQKTRPDINIHPDYAATQPTWWVHQKWIEELYDLRSSAVHDGGHGQRKWGWSLNEHLVMAAYAFPLTVKLLLAAEGHYTLTSADETQWKSIDKLLGVTGWDGDEDSEEDNGRAWHKIVSDAKWDHDVEKRMEQFLKDHPDFSWGKEG